MTGGSIAMIMSAIREVRETDLAEIKQKLDMLNGRTRDNEQALSALMQWRRDYEKVNDEAREEIEEEIKALRDRTNIIGSVLAVVQAVVAGVGALLLGEIKRP